LLKEKAGSKDKTTKQTGREEEESSENCKGKITRGGPKKPPGNQESRAPDRKERQCGRTKGVERPGGLETHFLR